MSDKKVNETVPEKCAKISTKRMYVLLLSVEEKILFNNVDKKSVIDSIEAIKHDVFLLNNENNSIERDLFY